MQNKQVHIFRNKQEEKRGRLFKLTSNHKCIYDSNNTLYTDTQTEQLTYLVLSQLLISVLI